ncbi:MAG TPA: hypothetical protein VKX16_11770 [Chloroflexota bacterium]|nr:hypothetical protein [Chloroflexota bacterium]
MSQQSAATVLEALAKGGLAGIIVAAILLLPSGSRVAGVLVMTPVITATSFFFVGMSHGPSAARQLALSALLAFPVTLVFVVAMYLFLGRLAVVPSLVASYALWAVAAAGYLLIAR